MHYERKQSEPLSRLRERGWGEGRLLAKNAAFTLLSVLQLKKIRLNRTLDLQRHRVATAVAGLAGLYADPAFLHGILFHVIALDAVETDANTTLQGFSIVERTLRVDRQMIGRGIAHRDSWVQATVADFCRTG